MKNSIVLLFVLIFIANLVAAQATDSTVITFISKTIVDLDFIQIAKIKSVARNRNNYDFKLKVYGDWNIKAQERAINIGQVSGLNTLEMIPMGGRKNKFVIVYSTYELKD